MPLLALHASRVSAFTRTAACPRRTFVSRSAVLVPPALPSRNQSTHGPRHRSPGVECAAASAFLQPSGGADSSAPAPEPWWKNWRTWLPRLLAVAAAFAAVFLVPQAGWCATPSSHCYSWRARARSYRNSVRVRPQRDVCVASSDTCAAALADAACARCRVPSRAAACRAASGDVTKPPGESKPPPGYSVVKMRKSAFRRHFKPPEDFFPTIRSAARPRPRPRCPAQPPPRSHTRRAAVQRSRTAAGRP